LRQSGIAAGANFRRLRAISRRCFHGGQADLLKIAAIWLATLLAVGVPVAPVFAESGQDQQETAEEAPARIPVAPRIRPGTQEAQVYPTRS
jgi:hypothetical protein